jgi:hypothetical protein
MPFYTRDSNTQGYGYNVTELNGLLVTLFQRYSELLLRKFSVDFDQVSHPLRRLFEFR